MKLVNYYNKLKSLKVKLGDSYLIWQVLESFPTQFNMLKTSNNTQKDEWTIDEMIVEVTLEEESIKMSKPHIVEFVTSSSGPMDAKQKVLISMVMRRMIVLLLRRNKRRKKRKKVHS